MAYAQHDAERPYQSIDLESSPIQTGDHDERSPLSPRIPAFQSMPLPQQTHNAPSQTMYPPRPTFSQNPSVERMPGTATPSQSGHGHQGHKSGASWDVLGGLSKEWNGFDSRNASQAAFQYAEGKSSSTFFFPSSCSPPPPHNVILINLLTFRFFFFHRLQATHPKPRLVFRYVIVRIFGTEPQRILH